MTDERLKVVVPFLLGLVFLIVGMLMIWNETQIISSWQQADGKVLTSEVVTVRGKATFYRADIAYEYDYGGTMFIGSCCKQETASRSDQQEIVYRNQPGDTVQILVNPADHSQSRMKEDVQPLNILYVALVSIGGLFAFSFGYKLLHPETKFIRVTS